MQTETLDLPLETALRFERDTTLGAVEGLGLPMDLTINIVIILFQNMFSMFSLCSVNCTIHVQE